MTDVAEDSVSIAATDHTVSPDELLVAPTSLPSPHPPASDDNAEVGRDAWLSVIWLVVSLGLLTVAVADTYARAGQPGMQKLFWIGLALIGAPVVLRLAAASVNRTERVVLVLVFGMACYLVKIMHSPLVFTFSDEQLHLTTATAILQQQHLFQPNFILPSVGVYPGLETITVAIAQLSGLSLFSSGLIVIGAARLILMLALFLLYETVSGSARVAGLAAVLYAGNWNFLFWSAQFSYESLALPLMLVVLVVLSQLHIAGRRRERGLIAAAVVVIAAIVMTHHVTSYVLLVLLVGSYLISFIVSKEPQHQVWPVILFAFAATVGWLVFVATLTVSYLAPVLTNAVAAVVRLGLGQEKSRELFTPAASAIGDVPPLLERVTGLGSAGLISLCIPLGLWIVWRCYRRSVFGLIFAGLALVFYPIMALRLTSAGWETSNRASEFLFIGIAWVIALAVVQYVGALRWVVLRSVVLLVGTAILIAGGVIGGWPPPLRLARPVIVRSGDAYLVSQPIAVGQWMRSHLGTGNRIGAPAAEALTTYLYGDQRPFTGTRYGLRDALLSDTYHRNEQEILGALDLHYVVLDARRASWDNMRGLYFDLTTEAMPVFDATIFTKFDTAPTVDRIYDSGHVVVYDLGQRPE